MLLSLIRMIQAFRDYQRNVSELSQLSDRELADIGLDRSDIPRVAAGHVPGLISFSPHDERITPASLRALSYPMAENVHLGKCTDRRKALTLSRHDRPPTLPTSVHMIGAGLAGSEAAWQVANAGVPVVLHEMRPDRMTEAHRTDGLAELVCSNSFRSDDAANNAVGLLHAEMRRLGSLIMRAADANQVPAGGALAVDRDGFSAAVTKALNDHPLIEIARGEIAGLPPADWSNVIVATGPLTSAPLADAIRELTDENALAFFDAIAPIVHRDSIDMSVAWFQSRYDKVGPGGTGADYINCPMTKEQYDAFVAALIAGEKTDFKEWETNTPYFDGCLPIEVMAERGRETLRHGPMKPVGLTNPHDPDHEGLRDRAAAPGQQARHALQHRRLPDQAEARRAAAHLPHHSGAGEGRIRPPRRPASQHLPELAKAARRPAAAARAAAAALCRPDDRLRGLRGIRQRSA